jgi:FAD/FMN-containing dehydrogenase
MISTAGMLPVKTLISTSVINPPLPRSTGAFALSIWTHNFKHIERRRAWSLPGRNETDDVVICGSGNNWGSVYTAVHRQNRTVVGGEDGTVGLGGLIQNGGHGFLSSHYGLASDQVYQVTVVTTDGRVLVANSAQNDDLFWAIRGGGGGQYGVVTEFVLKTYPVPENVVMGGFSFYAANSSTNSENATWNALSEVVSSIPDLMDGRLNGNVTAYTKTSAMALGLTEAPPGVAAIVGFVGLNMTTGHMDAIVDKLAARVASIGHGSYLNISQQQASTQNYWSFVKPNPLSSHSAGSVSLMTSRLLGRRELSDIPQDDLKVYLQQALISENPDTGTMLLFGLQGGRGPAKVPTYMRGSVHPAWRNAYAHTFTLGASIDATGDPSESLKAGANWYELAKEPVWRNWAPNTGSYMNEGNPFSSTWKDDFYGENYEKLLAIKRKYDPSESLFVWSGVGSDLWNYDLKSGLLCRVKK